MKNEFLRHTIATINYRFNKSIQNIDKDFGEFSMGKGSRTPTEIIHHMYVVLDATKLFLEQAEISNQTVEKFDLYGEINRFNLELKFVDELLEKKECPINYTKRLLQGPFSDILTHVGQISMLRRLYGNPIKGEDFSSAVIETGLS